MPKKSEKTNSEAEKVIESTNPDASALSRKHANNEIQPDIRPHPKASKKRRVLSEQLEFALNQNVRVDDGTPEGMVIPRIQALIEKLFECAFEGESWAMQMVFDRTEGKVGVSEGTQVVRHEINLVEKRADGTKVPYEMPPLPKKIESKVVDEDG